MAAVFAKLAPDLHRNPKVRRAGRDARDVFVFILCANADRGATGTVAADYVDPWYLSDSLQMTEDDVRTGLDRCFECRLLEKLPDGSVKIVGWDEEEWGRARHGSMTEAERKNAQRAAKKARESLSSTDVRTCPDKQSPMSGRPDMSRESETDQKQIRSEEEKEKETPAVPADLFPADRPTPKPDPAADLAVHAAAEISRVSGRRFGPSKAVIGLCRALVRDGHGPAEVTIVAEHKAREWLGGKLADRVCPATLLAASNFANYLDEARAGPPTRAPPSAPNGHGPRGQAPPAARHGIGPIED